MKRLKQAIRLLIPAAMLLILASVSAFAASIEIEGMTADLTDGVLTVSGCSECDVAAITALPRDVTQEIESIVFGEEVKTIVRTGYGGIGIGAFPKLKSVELLGAESFSNAFAASPVVSVSAPQAALIADSAFGNCSALKNVSAPQAAAVGSNAFYGCSALESVSLPRVTTVGSSAFINCAALESISLPQVTTIGSYAFYGCGALTDFDLSSVVTVGESAFSGTILSGEPDLSSAATIGSSAFKGTGLTGELDLSSAVTVGSSAFEGTGVESVSFGRSLSTLSAYAFRNCSALKSIRFFGKCVDLKNYSAISASAFTDCSDYTIYYCPLFSDGGEGMVPMENDDTVFSGTFYEEGFSWSLSGSGTLTVTGSGAMPDVNAASGEWRDYAGRIGRIVIGEGITRLGRNCFKSDYSHKLGAESGCTLVLPEGLEEIGEGCFEESRISSVVFPSTLTAIGSRAFYSCKALETVSAPQVTTVGSYAFYGCDSLESAAFGEITVIENSCFAYCGALESFDFTGVTRINEMAFRSAGLTGEVVLPDVSTVGRYAFNGCADMESLRFGEGLSGVDGFSFGDCASLKSVYFLGNCPSSGDRRNAFNGSTDCTLYYYPIFTADGNGMVPMESDEEFLSGPFYTDGFRWSLSKGGTLTISGCGSTPYAKETTGDWWAYGSRVRRIVIEEGITRIGNYSFATDYSHKLGAEAGCTLILPEGLEEIGEFCFKGVRLSSVVFPSTLTGIEANAFSGVTALKSVSLPELKTIGQAVFPAARLWRACRCRR